MKKIVSKLIDFYQLAISPRLGIRCRHKPTCSEYAREAFKEHNFFYASFLTTKRLLKCNPLFKPRYDPVPLSKKSRMLKLNEIEEVNDDSTINKK